MAAQAVEGDQLLETVAGRVVDRVALGDTLKLDGVHETTSVAELNRGKTGRRETGKGGRQLLEYRNVSVV
jgi:hypothetical protein